MDMTKKDLGENSVMYVVHVKELEFIGGVCDTCFCFVYETCFRYLIMLRLL